MCSSGEPAPFLLREGPRGLGVVEEEEEELELQEVSRAWPLLKGPVLSRSWQMAALYVLLPSHHSSPVVESDGNPVHTGLNYRLQESKNSWENGFQAQLDPGGLLCISPFIGLPSLYTNSSLI